jgi:hypothetical protein
VKTAIRIAIALSWCGYVEDAINTFGKLSEKDLEKLED